MARQSKPHLHKGYWRCRIDGHEHHLGRDRRAAMAEFHRLMAGKLADAVGDVPETVAGAVNQWATLYPESAYTAWLPPFIGFAGSVYLDDVSPDLLTRFVVHLRQQRVKRNTFNKRTREWSVQETDKALSVGTMRHYLKAAHTILEWAHKQGWSRVSPDVPKLPKARRAARDVPTGRLVDVLEGLPKRARRILSFIAATGCRPGEACRLEWRHVQLDKGTAILDEHKTADETGEPRTLYLTEGATAILRMMIPTDGPVFTSRLGRPYTPSGLRSILKRHGSITPYQLRHSFAQVVSDSGEVPLEVLSRLLGHTDTKTTEFYFKVRDARAIKAASGIKVRIASAG